MKYLILIVSLCMSAHTFACQLSIPESYVPTFLNPPVSGHYEKCEAEPCHCVDNVDPYISELVTEHREDPETGINIPVKILKESAEKKFAHEAKIAKDLKDINDAKLAKIAQKLKAKADINKATTIAQLRKAMEDYILSIE